MTPSDNCKMCILTLSSNLIGERRHMLEIGNRKFSKYSSINNNDTGDVFGIFMDQW